MQSPSSQKFSWDNLRQDGSRFLARLDRVYLFQATGTTSRKLVSYRICGDSAWSDHLPVEATVELEVGGHQKSCWQMSTYWLEEAEQQLKDLWKS
jgi:hypothetical protein